MLLIVLRMNSTIKIDNSLLTLPTTLLTSILIQLYRILVPHPSNLAKALLLRNRLGIDTKIAKQTFEVISYFNLQFLLPALFCLKVVYKYLCFCEKNTSFIGMTTRHRVTIRSALGGTVPLFQALSRFFYRKSRFLFQ